MKPQLDMSRCASHALTLHIYSCHFAALFLLLLLRHRISHEGASKIDALAALISNADYSNRFDD